MATAAIERPARDAREAEERLDAIWADTRQALRPPPLLTVSQWADRYRVVPSYSAEPGRWVTEKTPYLRDVMDAFSDPAVNKVVFMKCARIGATEAGLNVIGYFVDQDPSPIFIVQPTVDDAKDFSKEQLTPTIEDTECLRLRISEAAARDSGNTIQSKLFPGGALYLVGANSPRGFRRRTARVVILEEVDGYPPSAGTEGDQVKLAERRATTYQHRRKVYLNSTPTLKGASRIATEFAQSDQRYFFVPCPACGHEQALAWPHLKWDDGQPETAAYACAGCGVLIEERQKFAMVQRGRWVATNPGPATVGFHINALYSPWVRWAELAQEWTEAQGDVGKLQVFVNTALGEVWEDRTGGLSSESLLARREAWKADVPAWVGLLTCGVDVQHDRLEAVVRGWGAGEETATLRRVVILGDATGTQVWADLEELLLREWRREDGAVLRIQTACVDSGDNAEMVHRFCAPRYGRRVYATRGYSKPGKPLVAKRPSRNNKARCPVFYVGTDTAKDLIFGRIKIASGPDIRAPMAWHFHVSCDEDYFAQLTAERRVRKQQGGRWVSEYQLLPNRRNEVLDCEALNVVALALSGVKREQLGSRAASLEPADPAPDGEAPPAEPPTPIPGRRAPGMKRANWVNRW